LELVDINNLVLKSNLRFGGVLNPLGTNKKTSREKEVRKPGRRPDRRSVSSKDVAQAQNAMYVGVTI
jgi:hypothetical protein